MEQSVPKRRRINSRRRVITQKKAYNVRNTAKAWNQEADVVIRVKVGASALLLLPVCVELRDAEWEYPSVA